MHGSWIRKTAVGLQNADGKGLTGCLVFLVLLGILCFAVIRVGPDYYAFKGFEADVKTEAARAGANFFDDETIVRDVLDLARKNEIHLKQENVKVERFAGQVFIKIHYVLEADFIVYKRNIDMDFSVSSYIGRL
jgi:hypothetical protein